MSRDGNGHSRVPKVDALATFLDIDMDEPSEMSRICGRAAMQRALDEIDAEGLPFPQVEIPEPVVPTDSGRIAAAEDPTRVPTLRHPAAEEPLALPTDQGVTQTATGHGGREVRALLKSTWFPPCLGVGIILLGVGVAHWVHTAPMKQVENAGAVGITILATGAFAFIHRVIANHPNSNNNN